MNARCYIIFSLLAPHLAGAPVNLTVQPGGVGQTSYVTDAGYAYVEIPFGGVLQADVTIDPVSGKPQTFQYLPGGALTYADGSTDFTPTTLPQLESFEFIFVGLASTLSSQPGGGAVDQATCLLTAGDHQVTLDTGILTIRYYFLGELIAEVIQDYSQDPVSADSRGASKVTASLISNGVLEDRYLVTLEHDSTYSAIENGITVNETGGFVATGEVLVPSVALSEWVVASGGPAPGSGTDLLGAVPVSILYALGLSVGEQEIPWTLQPELGQVTLNLPLAGTRADLLIETSEDLENWTAQPLAAGTVGAVIFSLPVDHTFFRLAVPPGL